MRGEKIQVVARLRDRSLPKFFLCFLTLILATKRIKKIYYRMIKVKKHVI
ncbi:MAG TPA: hypothetical protein DEB17_02685 [Chlorobaculum sp.]|uniref:Uncharacterized protein n=1 Tax=Chlorobaculum tepidum (strain ATCC 49652 / DSM 12025 / NBRC 103806 / TLS) TaxID=194439 RepID=Q8KEE8_CHLTE|nr:hypothetical protein CT0741 [Chlorobaculum tepidum TLS]HBU22898.1 hypothetical protein [Chlorobaculum sp.]